MFGLGKFLFGNNLAGYQRLHTFVFFLADFVGDTGFLYGVTFGHVLRREGKQRSAFAYLHTFDYLVAERYDTSYGGNGYAFIALCGQYLSTGLDDLVKGARFYGADLYTCCLGFGWWQDYFTAAGTVPFFGFVVMTVVVVSFVKFGLMVVVLGLVIVSVVIVGGLVLTGAQ